MCDEGRYGFSHVHDAARITRPIVRRGVEKTTPRWEDIPEIVRAAVATGTALEINSAWKRLDLNDRHVRHAVDAGAMLSINTDSHDTPQLQQMRYGVATARRGWATADRVINTMSLKQLLAWKAHMQ